MESEFMESWAIEATYVDAALCSAWKAVMEKQAVATLLLQLRASRASSLVSAKVEDVAVVVMMVE